MRHPHATIHFIRFLLKSSLLSILLATAAGLISGSCNAVLISLVNQSIGHDRPTDSLLYFAGLMLFMLLTSIASQFMLVQLSQSAIYQLRLRLSQIILSTPLAHLENLGNNRLLASLTDDVRMLSQSVSVIPNLCIDLATIIGCLAYLSWLSGSVSLLTIVAIGAASWMIQALLHRARHLFMMARDEEDHLFHQFQAILLGTKELKLHRARREDFITHQLQASMANMRQRNSRAMKHFAVADGLGQFLMFAVLGFTIFALPQLITTSKPMLATYVLTITYLTSPLQNLLHRLPDLMQGNVALHKLERMKLSLALYSEEEAIDLTPIESQCQLEMKQVEYQYYPDGEEHGFTLGPISLAFQPGQITYIVGGNGSGKSTLAKLIAGLYTPEAGSIHLNGISITDRNREWYRQHFSAVFSDFYLFDRCLGFNRSHLDQDVTDYLKQLKLDHKVKVRNGVLSTTRLSQGQRKRLALLTAYLEDRPIYLFDEWASDQEPLFRDLFYRQILPKLKQQGKAIIVITHDDRYFHLADQVVKLDYGQVEVGVGAL